MITTDFTKKRVESLTLGEKLRKVRTDSRIGLPEVSRATGIRVKYLEAIETGTYGDLPPDVYVRGFLRGYAAFLGVPEPTVLKLYERERGIRDSIDGKASDSFRGPGSSGTVRSRHPVSVRDLAFGLIGLIVIGSFLYLYLEFRSFVSEPRLTILAPADGDTVEETEAVVRGETDPRAVVRINDEEVVVDEHGSFSETLSLDSGLNVIGISSTNRFGKTRERSVSVNADLPERIAAEAVLSDPESALSVRVGIRMLDEASVSVEVDGRTVWNGELSAGEEREFSGRESVTVSADSGASVMVRSGDGSESPLSSDSGGATVSYGPDEASE
jgi:cytoskeletal protein RodZ